MSSIVLPRPDNMRGDFGELVTDDLYHIAERVQEIDSRLLIFKIHAPNGAARYSIVEQCADRVDRLVFRTDALDARVVEHLQYLLHVPFEYRFAEMEKIEAKAEADRQEQEKDELYERVGRPMWTQLEHDGFIESRGLSYAKRGVAGGRGSRRRS